MRLLAGILPSLSRMAPGLTAVVADWLFFSPARTRPSARALGRLGTARRERVDTPEGRIAVWRWGTGPLVYLMHGWSGNAGQMAALAAPLVEAGFGVVAFDAPGHGASSGARSSGPQFARTLMALVERFGPAHAVVAHSLGAAATALALADVGLETHRVVFVGPAANPPEWARRFSALLGASEDVIERMRLRSERRLGFEWKRLNVPAVAVELEAPLLVIHDRQDREVPWSDGAAIVQAWTGARLSTTEGLGHRRILEDADVVAEVVAFVSDGREALPACALCGSPRIGVPGATATAALCASCDLERMLMTPEGRIPAGGLFARASSTWRTV